VIDGSHGSWGHSLLERPDLGEEARSEPVDLVPMVAVLREAAALAGRRLVVKVDAEGAECDIVLRTDPTMWESVDEVFLEHHDFAPCGLEEIAAHLGRAGLTRREDRHGVERFRRAGLDKQRLSRAS
jgi:hypothetical protein